MANIEWFHNHHLNCILALMEITKLLIMSKVIGPKNLAA